MQSNQEEEIAKRVANAYENLQRHYDELTKSKKELQLQIGNTQSEIEKLIVNIQDYSKRLKQNDISARENLEITQEYEKQKNLVEDDTHQLNEINVIIEKSVIELCQERKNYKKISKKKEGTLSDLIKIKQYVKAYQNMPSCEQNNQILLNNFNELNRKIKTKREQLESKMQEVQNELDQSIEEDKSKKIELNNINNEIQEIEDRIHRRENTIAFDKQTINEQQIKCERIQSELAKLDIEKAGLNQKIATSMSTIESIKSKAIAIGLNLQKETARVENVNKNILSVVSEYEEKTKNLEKAIREKETAVLQQVQKNIDSKQSEIDEILDEISQNNTEIELMQKKIDGFEKEHEQETIQLKQINERTSLLEGFMLQFVNIGRVE